MDCFYEDSCLIDTRDMDLFDQCRPSAILGHLQEAATQGAAALGLSREACLENYGAFWMVSRIKYELFRPIRWGEELTVKTWHRGGRMAMAYREFELRVGEEVVGKALSIWVLADWQTRKLVRLSAVKEFAETTGGSLCTNETLHKLKLPEELTAAGSRRMNYSDTDINGHINNSRYADFACDALALEKLGEGKFVSSLQVDFVRECLPGEGLDLFTARDEDGAWYAVGKGEEGETRFEARLTLEDVN